jgi:hypothetical protein
MIRKSTLEEVGPPAAPGKALFALMPLRFCEALQLILRYFNRGDQAGSEAKFGV